MEQGVADNVIYVQVDEQGRVVNYTSNIPNGEQVILLQDGGDGQPMILSNQDSSKSQISSSDQNIATTQEQQNSNTSNYIDESGNPVMIVGQPQMTESFDMGQADAQQETGSNLQDNLMNQPQTDISGSYINQAMQQDSLESAMRMNEIQTNTNEQTQQSTFLAQSDVALDSQIINPSNVTETEDQNIVSSRIIGQPSISPNTMGQVSSTTTKPQIFATVVSQPHVTSTTTRSPVTSSIILSPSRSTVLDQSGNQVIVLGHANPSLTISQASPTTQKPIVIQGNKSRPGLIQSNTVLTKPISSHTKQIGQTKNIIISKPGSGRPSIVNSPRTLLSTSHVTITKTPPKAATSLLGPRIVSPGASLLISKGPGGSIVIPKPGTKQGIIVSTSVGQEGQGIYKKTPTNVPGVMRITRQLPTTQTVGHVKVTQPVLRFLNNETKSANSEVSKNQTEEVSSTVNGSEASFENNSKELIEIHDDEMNAVKVSGKDLLKDVEMGGRIDDSYDTEGKKEQIKDSSEEKKFSGDLLDYLGDEHIIQPDGKIDDDKIHPAVDNDPHVSKTENSDKNDDSEDDYDDEFPAGLIRGEPIERSKDKEAETVIKESEVIFSKHVDEITKNDSGKEIKSNKSGDNETDSSNEMDADEDETNVPMSNKLEKLKQTLDKGKQNIGDLFGFEEIISDKNDNKSGFKEEDTIPDTNEKPLPKRKGRTKTDKKSSPEDVHKQSFMAKFNLVSPKEMEKLNRRSSKRVLHAEAEKQKADIIEEKPKSVKKTIGTEDEGRQNIFELFDSSDTNVESLQGKVKKLQMLNSELKRQLKDTEQKLLSSQAGNARFHELKSMQHKIEKLEKSNQELTQKVQQYEGESQERTVDVSFKMGNLSFKTPTTLGSPSAKKSKLSGGPGGVHDESNDVKAKEESIEKRERKLRALDQELDLRTAMLKAKESKLQRLVTEIKTREQKLEYQESAIERRVKDIEYRERMLEGKTKAALEKMHKSGRRSQAGGDGNTEEEAVRNAEMHRFELEQKLKEIKAKEEELKEKERSLIVKESELQGTTIPDEVAQSPLASRNKRGRPSIKTPFHGIEVSTSSREGTPVSDSGKPRKTPATSVKAISRRTSTTRKRSKTESPVSLATSGRGLRNKKPKLME